MVGNQSCLNTASQKVIRIITPRNPHALNRNATNVWRPLLYNHTRARSSILHDLSKLDHTLKLLSNPSDRTLIFERQKIQGSRDNSSLEWYQNKCYASICDIRRFVHCINDISAALRHNLPAAAPLNTWLSTWRANTCWTLYYLQDATILWSFPSRCIFLFFVANINPAAISIYCSFLMSS